MKKKTLVLLLSAEIVVSRSCKSQLKEDLTCRQGTQFSFQAKVELIEVDIFLLYTSAISQIKNGHKLSLEKS